MREILFKAKRADNREWVTGYYIKSIVKDSVWGYIRESRAGTDIKIILNTLCQYTGLKDCNGNKIWENDIIRLYDMAEEDYMVIWYKEMGAFVIGDIETHAEHIDLVGDIIDEIPYVEVIGNIFDNKEQSGGDK